MLQDTAPSGHFVLERMTPFQWRAVAVCVLLTMLDGFDVMTMAFTAPHVSADWQLSGKLLGMLFSAGLIGMAVGALALAPLADRVGRRALILVCLVILTVAMSISALAGSAWQLGALRLLTGVGIGGMLACVAVTAGEFSSPRWRNTAIVLQVTGYPVGATLGGVIAELLIRQWSWPSVFVLGAVASLLSVPLVLAFLPESLEFLIIRRPPDAVARFNAVLARMGMPPYAVLPPPPPQLATQAQGYWAMFDAPMRRHTLLVALGFFSLMFAFYFVISWTPKLLVTSGASAAEGITGGVLLNLGGIGGGILFSGLASCVRLSRLTVGSLLLMGLAMLAFGLCSTQLNWAFAMALLTGAAMFAAVGGMYAIVPIVFTAAVRSTALGWAIGVGRFGAILSPFCAGVLLDAGWSPAWLFVVCGAPLLVAAAAVVAMRLPER
ncbi:MFS transporter [Xanthomonas oryzae pv. oryzicola]|uniref:MFS transporter n=1 Tax=Xanthomonas oryzae pv. oryzicola (strain BLS256) TaxID=383407 RepID=G7TBB6_XANOB|nr:MFS transporter [Xanthomonas oryzae]AEQ98622.1 MFS transporter [Xanthomonas oryzae pv. oryzicola BLS256]AJQ85832.1 MFS transporter [Xanthomonas oryzae pv. oryzicola]AKK65747.1 MFS transporter [Xanthomonas oryzae pv. oryzicola]AKN91788.1 MFS transporter [Xanthomonas oryzae pv. oryzicola]AKN95529.1 MFS transporter [Xanthomonas oryzae pv. oryzicola]